MVGFFPTTVDGERGVALAAPGGIGVRKVREGVSSVREVQDFQI